MAYEDLTAREKRLLQGWLNEQLRPWAGRQARMNVRGAAVNTAYNAQITEILGQLVDADEIPNKTNLDGASDLTKAEVITLMSHVQTVVGQDGTGGVNTQAHRQLAAKAIGGVNIA